ncbi:MAG: acyl-CoA dehydrogenase [Alphaproteobacteria bacterium]|nr:MAG: acyl-CoA dehydrogenase [Alphaproteobacteria bacterium]
MTFKLVEGNPVVKWPVIIPVPQDGGRIQRAKIWLHFEVVPLEELMQALPEIDASLEDPETRRRIEDFFAEHVKDWEGVEDENGKPVPFSDEDFRRLFRLGFAQAPIAQAYRACLEGRQAKN